MKKLYMILPLTLILCFMVGCQKTKDVAEEPAVDVEAEKQIAHKAAIDSKDIEGILQYYSPDLITISPGEPILYGNDWIRTTLNDLYNTYEFTEDFKFIDIRIIGDRVAASYSFTQQMSPLAGGEKIEQDIAPLLPKFLWVFPCMNLILGGEALIRSSRAAAPAPAGPPRGRTL